MQSRKAGGQQPVGFFGKGLINIAGSKSRLNVPDRDAQIESRKRTGHRGGGIALNQNDIRPLLVEHWLKASQDTGGRLKQGLAGQHQIEVVVRHNVKCRQNLIEKPAVLSRDAYPNVEFRVLF